MRRLLKYVGAKIEKEAEELVYKTYVTDTLRGFFKGVGGDLPTRYYDIVAEKKVENRTSDEIVEGIRKKLRIVSEV